MSSLRSQGSTSHGVATIAQGAAISDAIEYRGFATGHFLLPAVFTGSTVSFQASADDGVTYTALYDLTNALVSIPVTQGRQYPFPPELWGASHVKIVSGSAEASGERSIKYSVSH